jgi:hypothetical protein
VYFRYFYLYTFILLKFTDKALEADCSQPYFCLQKSGTILFHTSVPLDRLLHCPSKYPKVHIFGSYVFILSLLPTLHQKCSSLLPYHRGIALSPQGFNGWFTFCLPIIRNRVLLIILLKTSTVPSISELLKRFLKELQQTSF